MEEKKSTTTQLQEEQLVSEQKFLLSPPKNGFIFTPASSELSSMLRKKLLQNDFLLADKTGNPFERSWVFFDLARSLSVLHKKVTDKEVIVVDFVMPCNRHSSDSIGGNAISALTHCIEAIYAKYPDPNTRYIVVPLLALNKTKKHAATLCITPGNAPIIFDSNRNSDEIFFAHRSSSDQSPLRQGILGKIANACKKAFSFLFIVNPDETCTLEKFEFTYSPLGTKSLTDGIISKLHTLSNNEAVLETSELHTLSNIVAITEMIASGIPIDKKHLLAYHTHSLARGIALFNNACNSKRPINLIDFVKEAFDKTFFPELIEETALAKKNDRTGWLNLLNPAKLLLEFPLALLIASGEFLKQSVYEWFPTQRYAKFFRLFFLFISYLINIIFLPLRVLQVLVKNGANALFPASMFLMLGFTVLSLAAMGVLSSPIIFALTILPIAFISHWVMEFRTSSIDSARDEASYSRYAAAGWSLLSLGSLIAFMITLLGIFNSGATLPTLLGLNGITWSMTLASIFGITSWLSASHVFDKTSSSPYVKLAAFFGAGVVIFSPFQMISLVFLGLSIACIARTVLNSKLSIGEKTIKNQQGEKLLYALKVLLIFLFSSTALLSIATLFPSTNIEQLSGILVFAFNMIAKALGYAGFQMGTQWLSTFFVPIFSISTFSVFGLLKSVLQKNRQTRTAEKSVSPKQKIHTSLGPILVKSIFILGLMLLLAPISFFPLFLVQAIVTPLSQSFFIKPITGTHVKSKYVAQEAAVIGTLFLTFMLTLLAVGIFDLEILAVWSIFGIGSIELLRGFTLLNRYLNATTPVKVPLPEKIDILERKNSLHVQRKSSLEFSAIQGPENISTTTIPTSSPIIPTTMEESGDASSKSETLLIQMIDSQAENGRFDAVHLLVEEHSRGDPHKRIIYINCVARGAARGAHVVFVASLINHYPVVDNVIHGLTEGGHIENDQLILHLLTHMRPTLRESFIWRVRRHDVSPNVNVYAAKKAMQLTGMTFHQASFWCQATNVEDLLNIDLRSFHFEDAFLMMQVGMFFQQPISQKIGEYLQNNPEDKEQYSYFTDSSSIKEVFKNEKKLRATIEENASKKNRYPNEVMPWMYHTRAPNYIGLFSTQYSSISEGEIISVKKFVAHLAGIKPHHSSKNYAELFIEGIDEAGMFIMHYYFTDNTKKFNAERLSTEAFIEDYFTKRVFAGSTAIPEDRHQRLFAHLEKAKSTFDPLIGKGGFHQEKWFVGLFSECGINLKPGRIGDLVDMQTNTGYLTP